MLECLIDLKISKAKPTSKPYKLTDGGSLCVIVTPQARSGDGRIWKIDAQTEGDTAWSWPTELASS
jgi:hypothetical protein